MSRIFEIPKDKSEDFIKMFNEKKISDEFLDECRESAVKLGRKQTDKPLKRI